MSMDMPMDMPMAQSPPAAPNTANSSMDMSGGQSMSTMAMQMSFYWGPQVTILFAPWTTSSWGPYLGSLLVCLLLAVCYEGLTTFRVMYTARLKARLRREIEESGDDAGGEHGGSKKPSLSWIAKGKMVDRLVAALLIGISAAAGYLLMLMIMSFNVGVFIAIVLGHSAGVFLFGGIRVLTESSLFADSHCGSW